VYGGIAFVFGALAALIYNVIARFAGGVVIETSARE